jgi:hypothetical protein
VSDIFQEVQEEYRREQMAQAWKKYRVPLISAAVALVVLVAGYQGWTFWRAQQIEDSSRQFEAANLLTENPTGEAAAAAAYAKLANEGAGGYTFAARFQAAAALATKDAKGAVALYDQIAESGAGGPLFADYARIRAAMLLADAAPLAEMKRRLDPLAGSDSPWRIEAEEFLAYANWRAGNKAEAQRLLDLIKNNPEATSGTKQRAVEFAAMIASGLKVSDIKAPPAPALAPGGPLVPDLPSFDAPASDAPAPTAPPTPTP